MRSDRGDDGRARVGAQAVIDRLPQKTAAIGPYLQRVLGHAKGPGMIDRALAKLKAGGYGQPG